MLILFMLNRLFQYVVIHFWYRYGFDILDYL